MYVCNRILQVVYFAKRFLVTRLQNNQREVVEYKGTGCAFNHILSYDGMARNAGRDAQDERGSYKIIATNPVQAWCGGVAHVDRKRRLPRIAEMHVEAGGQSDLVGKRSRCDSTDSVENLGTFCTYTHTWSQANARTRTRV